MTDRSWKRVERDVAHALGGRRIPVTGERAGADVTAGPFVVQVKHRKALPSWLWTWLAGIVQAARAKDQIGVLVLSRPRRPLREALVVLRWQDWVDLHGSDDRCR